MTPAPPLRLGPGSGSGLRIGRYAAVAALALLLQGAGYARDGGGPRAVGPLVLDGVPEIPPALAERMLQYQNARAAWVEDWDPAGGGLIVTTRFGETAQVHAVARPGGARRQLTFFKEPVRAVQARPGRAALEFAFLMDRGGTEDYQVRLFTAKDGRSRLLTDGSSRHEAILWSRSGARLAFVGNGRNGRDFDLYLAAPDEAGPPRRILELEGRWSVRDWAPDDSRLLLLKHVSANDSRPHVADLASGRVEPLFPGRVSSTAAVHYGDLRWSAGGRGVYFTSDEGGEFHSLGHLDLASGRVEWITPDIPWDVDELDVSPDGSLAAFSVNEEGWSALYLAGPGAKPSRIEGLPVGVVSGLAFDPAGSRLAFSLDSPRSPGDAYVLDARSRGLERWTESETGGLPREAFVEPELVRYPTFDEAPAGRRLIPAFYYRPRAPGPRPFVAVIHGGPEAQARPSFDSTIQYWVNELGVAVLEPNVRGSDGYGKAYLKLDDGFKREDSVKDIGALLDWAASRPELDASRAGVYGGSYGGYMVLASLARFPGRLSCGVDVVGISNFVTFLENTKDYRRDLRRVEYGDERDPAMRAFLSRISPTALAASIRADLFVAHGANDPRVPAGEAEAIVAAVRSNGGSVWYLLAKDEGHGFSKKSNRDVLGQAAALFWERCLLRREPAK